MTNMGTERRTGLDRRHIERRVMLDERERIEHPARASQFDSERDPVERQVQEETSLRLRDDGSLRSMAAPGLLIGAGLAALMDAAVFHHLLRWHHLASIDTAGSGSMAPEDLALDGVQQVIAGIAIALGVILLWNIGAQRPHSAWLYAGPSMLGWVMIGWALFNLAFVSVPQWVLDRHHINVENDPLTWDLIFLAVTVIIAIVGIALVKSRRPLDIEDDRDADIDRWAD